MHRTASMKPLALIFKHNNNSCCVGSQKCSFASHSAKLLPYPLFKEYECNKTPIRTRPTIYRTCHNQIFSAPNIALSNSSNIIKNKIDSLVTKYEEITGMDEVRLAQNRVIEAQDKFVIAQEKRRAIVQELTVIQNKLKEVHAELDATTRGEERYLSLVTKEHNLLKEEKKLTTRFNLLEREERDCFTFLSSSVKESHEKERAQAERTKYWSVIGSIIGTVIGVIGSSVNNEFKMRELRKLVQESAAYSQKSAEVDKLAADILTRHEEQLVEIVNEIRDINTHHEHPASSTLSRMLYNVDHPKVDLPIELLLEEQKKETRLILGFAIIVIPIVVACMNKML